MPFANISSDPDNVYFRDGIPEEILDEISTARQLTVIGSPSKRELDSAAAAVSVLRGVLAQVPKMGYAPLWLSNALLQQERRDEGLEILQRAYRIDPLHPSIAANISQALSERGDDEATLHLLAVIAMTPDSLSTSCGPQQVEVPAISQALQECSAHRLQSAAG